jgi:hypothetical protein
LVEAQPAAARQVFPSGLAGSAEAPQFRAWLLRRLKNHPLVAPVDPTRFIYADADLAALLKTLPLRPDDADRGTGL